MRVLASVVLSVVAVVSVSLHVSADGTCTTIQQNINFPGHDLHDGVSKDTRALTLHQLKILLYVLPK